MKKFFKTIVHGLAQFGHLLVSGKFMDAIDMADAAIEKYLPEALQVAQMIDAEYPNRTTEDFEKLAAKYSLHWNATMSNDEKETMLQNAALSEFRKLLPDVPNSLARVALNGVVGALRIAKANGAEVPNTPEVVPGDVPTTATT